MKEEELIVYRNLATDPLFCDFVSLMEHYRARPDVSAACSCLHRLLEVCMSRGFSGNLWHCYLAELLVNDENSYSMACEMRGEQAGSVSALALHDIRIIKGFYDFDFTALILALQLPEFSLVLSFSGNGEESKIYNARIRERIETLALSFDHANSAEAMLSALTDFYRDYGVGRFGLHKAFRVHHTEDDTVSIDPILRIPHVHLDDLVGYEIPKQKLIANTEAFVQGRKANNCLLFGDAGTGKSSSIKAIANQYYEAGLRMIELYKHQIKDLQAVIDQVKDRHYRFIIYMDDLSFEDFEVEYKYLKAVIEGGLEKKPENVLIYATSNRRHLINENYADKADRRAGDMHAGDTVQEKLSLFARFGVSIYFGGPDKKQFDEIVRVLAERNGITMPEDELLLEANKWELAHGGLSGRTAQQFIDDLCGRQTL